MRHRRLLSRTYVIQKKLLSHLQESLQDNIPPNLSNLGAILNIVCMQKSKVTIQNFEIKTNQCFFAGFIPGSHYFTSDFALPVCVVHATFDRNFYWFSWRVYPSYGQEATTNAQLKCLSILLNSDNKVFSQYHCLVKQSGHCGTKGDEKKNNNK